MKNENSDDLIAEAPAIATQAADILAQAKAETSPTLAQSEAPSSLQPPQAADDTAEPRKRGRPRKVRDPLILAKLGAELTKPRKIKSDENLAHGEESNAQETASGGGGIPPESTGPGKNFGNDEQGAAPTLPKKKYKKISVLPPNQQSPLNTSNALLSPDQLLRVRLTSGIRDAKIRALFDLMMQNPNLPMHQAMKVLGYSANSSPTHIVKSKSWQALVGTIFPDDELEERERFLLHNEDPRFVNASLDRIHKIKGSFNHTQTSVNVNIDGEVRQMSDQALYDIIDGEIVEEDEQDQNGNPIT